MRDLEALLDVSFTLAWYLNIPPKDVGDMSVGEIDWYSAKVSDKLQRESNDN